MEKKTVGQQYGGGWEDTLKAAERIENGMLIVIRLLYNIISPVTFNKLKIIKTIVPKNVDITSNLFEHDTLFNLLIRLF